MPQRGDELSLRHLPDVSDTSFSFQIPGNVYGDNLLAQDDLDFFRGVNVSGGTPYPSLRTTANRPVTRSQLTPIPVPNIRTSRTSTELSTFPTSTYHDVDGTKPMNEKTSRDVGHPDINNPFSTRSSKPRPRLITPSISRHPHSEGSTSSTPTTSIRANVNDDLNGRPPVDLALGRTQNLNSEGIKEAFLEKKTLSRAQRREMRILKAKEKIVESSSTKMEAASNLVDIRSCPGDANPVVHSSPKFPSSRHLPPSEDSKGDDSIADSIGASEGIAKRLVQYSQSQLISSFGVLSDTTSLNKINQRLTNESHVAETGTDTNLAQQETTNDSDSPLTLSQLSPRKETFPVPESAPTPPAKPPTSVSALRSSSKRPVSVATDKAQRKKRKVDAASPANHTTHTSASTRSANRQLAPTRQHSRLNVSGSSSRPAGKDIKTKLRGSVAAKNIPGPPIFQPKAKVVHDRSNAVKMIDISSSSTVAPRISRSVQGDPSRPVKSLSLNKENKGASSSTSSDKPPFYISLSATTLAESQERPEASLSARRGNCEEGSAELQPQRRRIPIPDFKALHAAQEAKLARLKQNVHLTVPQPIEWETGHRAKERQKFDEMIKEKEREQERVLDEQRKEREEQEERELRELRRKAIPRAHEIPAWYKEAPRKKDKALGSIGR